MIPRSGRPPGGVHGNPLQCSCLENPMDRGVWRATVHGVAKESDMTSQLNTTITTHILHVFFLTELRYKIPGCDNRCRSAEQGLARGRSQRSIYLFTSPSWPRPPGWRGCLLPAFPEETCLLLTLPDTQGELLSFCCLLGLGGEAKCN